MTEITKVNLSGSTFTEERISCTGRQLSMILNEIKDLTHSYVWYIVDVMVPGEYVIQPYSWDYKYCQKPLKIGSTEDLIAFALSIPQFERGIFLGVPKNEVKSIAWSTKIFDTEDSDYIEPCALMIRAFDTSYFEISSKRKDLVGRLATNLT